MSPAAISPHEPLHTRTELRLVHNATPVPSSGERFGSKQATLEEGLPYVLVAGTDAAIRSRMLNELRNLLPVSTRFLEASETWELLARAAGSRMVVLTDDLGSVSNAALVRLLGRRHPALPVLTVGNRAPTAVSATVDPATA